MTFPREYLEYVIKTYGPNQLIKSVGDSCPHCNKPNYEMVYGTAKELLDELNQREREKGAKDSEHEDTAAE